MGVLCASCRKEPIYADTDDDIGQYPTMITFDPGGTTGWCVMQVQAEALSDPGYAVLDNVVHWAQGQITGPEPKQIHEMAELVSAWPGALVITEDFILGSARKNRDMLSPVRLNAGLEYALWLQDRTYVLQAPGEKDTASDARLKAWGYYERTGGQVHARDATRHALVAWRKARGLGAVPVSLRSAWWPTFFDISGRLFDLDLDLELSTLVTAVSGCGSIALAG